MSLTGLPSTAHTMTGVSFHSSQLQRILIDNFILPFHRQEWKTLQQNTFMIPSLRKQLRKHTTLSPYLDFLHALTWINYDQSIQGNTIVYRTLPIQLLPEYEVYHTFYGKPSIYDTSRLETIKQLLQNSYINYDQLALLLR